MNVRSFEFEASVATMNLQILDKVTKETLEQYGSLSPISFWKIKSSIIHNYILGSYTDFAFRKLFEILSKWKWGESKFNVQYYGDIPNDVPEYCKRYIDLVCLLSEYDLLDCRGTSTCTSTLYALMRFKASPNTFRKILENSKFDISNFVISFAVKENNIEWVEALLKYGGARAVDLTPSGWLKTNELYEAYKTCKNSNIKQILEKCVAQHGPCSIDKKSE